MPYYFKCRAGELSTRETRLFTDSIVSVLYKFHLSLPIHTAFDPPLDSHICLQRLLVRGSWTYQERYVTASTTIFSSLSQKKKSQPSTTVSIGHISSDRIMHFQIYASVHEKVSGSAKPLAMRTGNQNNTFTRATSVQVPWFTSVQYTSSPRLYSYWTRCAAW